MSLSLSDVGSHFITMFCVRLITVFHLIFFIRPCYRPENGTGDMLTFNDYGISEACSLGSYDWAGWSKCSQTCGGGTRSRTEYSCFWDIEGDTEREGCNEWCYHGHHYNSGRCRCPSWRGGACCETCRHIYIPHCNSGRQSCGGTPDNIKCTSCEDPYYSGGYGKGCLACPAISNCDHRHCTQPSNNKCIRCHDDNVFFKRTTDDTKCERLCAWNNHYCWPGTCGSKAPYFTKNCQCDSGFKLVNNNGETSCQPTKAPSIETCLTSFSGKNGEKKQSSSTSSSTACIHLQDVYGNFKVAEIQYDMLAELTVQLSNLTKPLFIKESNFGVTDVTLLIKKKLISGADVQIGQLHLLEDMSLSTLARQTFSDNGNISTSNHSYELQNGEWLCVEFESLGGGYLKGINTRGSTHVVLEPTPYQKTRKTKTICYRYDNAAPVHCLAMNTCKDEPLYVKDRVTRSQELSVSFQYWFDPIPNSAEIARASSIESYRITLHETISSKEKVQVDTGKVFLRIANTNDTSMSVQFNKTEPMLYCIVLEVKDVADNVKQARRFFLYDNSSYLEIDQNNPLNVKSASVSTNFTWQTHHNEICLDWKKHFLNKYYIDNQFLNPIESDRLGLISGIYDQIDGLLPVSGTVNVNGIVKFEYFWNLKNGTLSNGTEVPNMTKQAYCKHFNLTDGQTYTFKVLATDIANNQLEDETTVHIDRSVPHIKSIWLQKGDHRSLFVHDSKELSTMDLYFEALDPHSGILNVNWAFGTTDSGTELLSGVLRPDMLKEVTCSINKTTCYCPDVGDCEISSYIIPLNKLIEANKNVGNHNRNYYFSIKATNNALLSNIEHVEILVDDSAPEPGTVFEGPVDAPDIDYTSDESIMVNWHGFIDHESGIKLYRVGIAPKCLSNAELVGNNRTDDLVDYAEVPYSVRNIRLKLNKTGKFFVSVIAMNNAMDPSKVVCSDGITRDVSPPSIHNLTLLHAGWSESIACIQGNPWLIDGSLNKVKLHPTDTCLSLCLNKTDANYMLETLPVLDIRRRDFDISDFLCQTVPEYNAANIVYIPDDYISIKWNTDVHKGQIDDYFVGFGRSASEGDSPALVRYTSTNRKTYFKRRHEGIGSNTDFYIFLKAISKAGVNRVLTIGPLLIDVTPPLKSELPVLEIMNEDVKVSWNNNTFYDSEQTTPITKIMFQFATEQGVVSPIHEWRRDIPNGCERCFKYPFHKLQAQDNDNGFNFFVKMFVYNMAGHFLEVNSKAFQLPSRYPPGNGFVYDVDPDIIDLESNLKDIDVHYTPNTLCAIWDGFKHHEDLHIEIGVGLDKATDDVIKFDAANNTEIECITSTDIQFDKTYYVLVRAKCSGGETVSSSNGIMLINATRLVDSLAVKIGKSCKHADPTFIHKVTYDQLNTNISVKVTHPLRIGTVYSLGLTDGNNKFIRPGSVRVDFLYAYLGEVDYPVNNEFVRFVPFVESPMFQLNIEKTLKNVSSITIYVLQCGEEKGALQSRDEVPVYWYFKKETPKSFRYEVSLTSVSNNQNGSQPIIGPVVVYDHSKSNNTLTLKTTFLNERSNYRVAIRICFHKHCVGPGYSRDITVLNDMPTGAIETTQIQQQYHNNKTCLDISGTWTEFTDRSDMMFYTWAISTDDSATLLLTSWRPIPASNVTQYKVQTCLHLPVHAEATMFMCVRGYSNAGTMMKICRQLNRTDTTPLPIETAYDFDTSIDQWKNIQRVLHSSDIGNKKSILHDNELNIATADSVIGGAIIYGTERTVSWYLMTSSHTPTYCPDDDDCEQELTTDVGFVIFPSTILRPNVLYYICIHANESIITREYFDETFSELSSCSNGFLIDNMAPTAGRIMVNDNDGYINTRTIEVSWTDFTDNVDGTAMGYPGNISHYQFKLGHTAGYDDIIKATSTCDMTWAASDLDIADGSEIYVSLTAFDYSGQNTSLVSDGYYVDMSPPITGDVILSDSIVDELYSSSHDIQLHLRNFKDDHSGISHFEIGIGSSDYNDDILPAKVYFTDDIDLRLEENAILDGYQYFIGVKVVNRAGLSSISSPVPIVFDKTPPIGGHVMDGNWNSKTDADFQSDIDVIAGHWTDFSDQQSMISYYRVGLGTRPYIDDVKRMIYVGLTKDVSWKGPFIVGQKYFITVEACNGAGLCRELCSDGIILDNSPPIGGLVRVGSDIGHQNYQRYNSSIRIQWTGFEDPQSGIERFDACIGEMPFRCDIVPIFPCLLQSNIIKTGIDLPLGKAIYATVIAFNKVGMNVTRSSDYFIVDDSAPSALLRPTFLTDYNAIPGLNVQWDRSILRVFWEFEDKESPIVKHELSLVTHHEGHTPVEHIEVGNVNKVTINLDGKNWLHNGDTYSLLVTCCNAAGHCTTEQSMDLIIDSTPPFMGGFKPPMTWENQESDNGTIVSQLTLTWYGFQDEESGIEQYYITASKTYSGQELMGGILKIPTNSSASEVTVNVTLEHALAVDDLVVLSVWAQNKAGLNSTIGKISVNALLTSKYSVDIASQKGILEIEKHSCELHFCNNDCTCAIVGQPCTGVGNTKPCQQLNDTLGEDGATYQGITVKGGLEESPQVISASSACISGHWTKDNDNSTNSIMRFEWSVGLLDQPIGEGIFDLNSGSPWNDIGLHQHFIHCLSTNDTLLHGEKYVIYVRAWYDFDIFMEFRSTPMIVDNTGPMVRKGRFVKDSDSSCVKDFDIIDWTDGITACWNGVFGDQQGGVIHYSVSLGTSSLADDIIATTLVYLNTSFTVANLNLTHGTRYYFTVSAYNNVGIHTTAVSDGFLVDTDIPSPGIVFNTRFHTNEPYQSLNKTFSLSWHGFTDHYSGIQSYHVGLVNETEADMSNVTFMNVGLQTSHTFHNLTLIHGFRYAGVVKAIDAAGHSSELVMSGFKGIDTTPPKGYVCTDYEIVDEFKDIGLQGVDENFTFLMNFTRDNLYLIQSSMYTNNTHIKADFAVDRFRLRLPLTRNYNGTRQLEYSFLSPIEGQYASVLAFQSDVSLIVSTSIQRCSNLTNVDTEALSVRQIGPNSIAVTVLVDDAESSIYNTLVGAGSTAGGFQIRPLSPLHGVTSGILHVDVPHATPVYITATVDNYAGLKSRFHANAILMDNTPPTIDNLTVKAYYPSHLSTPLGNTSAIMTEWKISDEESGIKACYCAIGSQTYSTDIVDFWRSDSLVSCHSNVLDLRHGSVVYVTVKCVNNVELVTDVYLSPLTILHSPPNVEQAELAFVRLNEETPNAEVDMSDTEFIQTNDSHVMFQWSRFSDISHIEAYEYRLLHGNTTITDWTNSGLRTMATIVTDKLTAGEVYTAEVKALNSLYSSKVISSSLLIYKGQPTLTGAPILMTQEGRQLRLDWSSVFETPQTIRITPMYSLSIGSRPGYNDIVDSLHISAKSHDIQLPESTITTVDVVEVFVSLTCYFNTGASTLYTSSLKM